VPKEAGCPRLCSHLLHTESESIHTHVNLAQLIQLRSLTLTLDAGRNDLDCFLPMSEIVLILQSAHEAPRMPESIFIYMDIHLDDSPLQQTPWEPVASDWRLLDADRRLASVTKISILVRLITEVFTYSPSRSKEVDEACWRGRLEPLLSQVLQDRRCSFALEITYT